ncbi:hypothetical protein HK104_006718, partial [Borealophlyctis nickersoniae]
MAAFDLHPPTDVVGVPTKVYFDIKMTLTSLLAPIACVFIGVYIAGAVENPSLRRILSGSLFAAIGICLMHFTAMHAMHIVLTWVPFIVVLSCLIAVTTTTTGLFLFFRLRAMWQTKWWKQVGCAGVMAGGVCAMHYTGMHAARYSPLTPDTPFRYKYSEDAMDVNGVLWVSLGFSSGCIILLAALLGKRIIEFRRYGSMGKRKGQLTLACLIVDDRGNILVDSEGKVPSRSVTGVFPINPSRPLSHPALLWFIRASANWAAISSMTRACRTHAAKLRALLEETLALSARTVHRWTPSDSSDATKMEPYYRLALTQELVALASALSTPIEDMGRVHSTVLETPLGYIICLVDVYAAGRVTAMTAKGFRWADPKHVSPLIASHLGVMTSASVREVVSDIPSFVRTVRQPISNGARVGLLVVVLRFDKFMVMVPEHDRSTIPSVGVSRATFEAVVGYGAEGANMISHHLALGVVGQSSRAAIELVDALGDLGVGGS